MKGWFAAVVAALLLSTPAMALEVSESTQLDVPVDRVWPQISQFCRVGHWHPAVEQCELRRQAGALERVLAVKGGVIEEKLLSMSYSRHRIRYAIVASPLPVKDYVASITLTPAGSGTRIVWQASFTPDGASNADAKKAISGIFTTGFDGLREKLSAK